MLSGAPSGEIRQGDLASKELTPAELERVIVHAHAANRGGSDTVPEGLSPEERERACLGKNMLGMFGEAAFCKWFTGAITIWDRDCNERDASTHKSDGGYDFPIHYGAPIQVKCRPLNFGWDTYLLDFSRAIKEGFYYVLTMRASYTEWRECLIVGWAPARELKAAYQDQWDDRCALPIAQLHPMSTFPLKYDPVTDSVLKIPGG